MASVDRDIINPVTKTTGVLARPRGRELFDHEMVLFADAHPELAHNFPIAGQDLDALKGRAINRGRGVVGEGGVAGPGVVGIAGGAIANPAAPLPPVITAGPHVGRGLRAGVIGVGNRIPRRGGPTGPSGALGVVGTADTAIAVLGVSTGNSAVYGASRITGVTGDGRPGFTGVEGISGSSYGVYGHVNYANPADNMVGVFGAAALSPSAPGGAIGRAGVFVGPLDAIGNLTVTGDQVVWGTKSAAAKHADGTHRLLYCVESPESWFEDFGEARLVKGQARVQLDPDFVSVADTRNYHVFLSPYGECRGLYVAARGGSSFRVREQGRGTSSLRFSYRIVAKRKGVAVRRFRKVKRPPMPTMQRQPAPLELELLGTGDGPRRRRAARRRARAAR